MIGHPPEGWAPSCRHAPALTRCGTRPVWSAGGLRAQHGTIPILALPRQREQLRHPTVRRRTVRATVRASKIGGPPGSGAPLKRYNRPSQLMHDRATDGATATVDGRENEPAREWRVLEHKDRMHP